MHLGTGILLFRGIFTIIRKPYKNKYKSQPQIPFINFLKLYNFKIVLKNNGYITFNTGVVYKVCDCFFHFQSNLLGLQKLAIHLH